MRLTEELKDYFGGIDPGSRTGICVVDLDCNIIEIRTVEFDEYPVEMLHLHERGLTNIAIEHSASTHIYKRPDTTAAVMLRIAQNVEKNRGMAREIYAFCNGLGMRTEYTKPAKTKVLSHLFKSITGWAGRTSSHARDAYFVACWLANLIKMEKMVK